jgi:hypothetical protein
MGGSGEHIGYPDFAAARGQDGLDGQLGDRDQMPAELCCRKR